MGPLLYSQSVIQNLFQGNRVPCRPPHAIPDNFQLNSITLSKNILRAIEVSKADMPPPEAFPRSHIVTFNYYVGVIMFLEENYQKASHHGEARFYEQWFANRGLLPCRQKKV